MAAKLGFEKRKTLKPDAVPTVSPRTVRCERCSESVKKKLLEEHHDRHCPYVECLCHEMVRRMNFGEVPRDQPLRILIGY